MKRGFAAMEIGAWLLDAGRLRFSRPIKIELITLKHYLRAGRAAIVRSDGRPHDHGDDLAARGDHYVRGGPDCLDRGSGLISGALQ